MDGINGLAGSLTVVNSAVFALIFYFNGQFNFALIAFAMLGSVLGFLRYNMRNAKIFMGDTGSLFLGLLMSVFVIKAFQSPINTELSISLALVPMFIPIFDTLRLITTRIMEGKSPLKADKNHLHHLVVNATRSHSQATFVIIVFHITLLGFVTFEMYSGGELLLNTLIGLLIFGVMVFLSFFIVVEMYRNLKRFRSHLKLLTGDNSLLKKL
jgi:UDP-N-acetylmuramyl pentapeptide phosphotransferase/UDP-N-acetylglucosamine-1-phosphate transferase